MTVLKWFKRLWCPVLVAIIYFATLIAWFDPEDMDILWSSIFNYVVIFPICGIMLGIHYGRYLSHWKWILPVGVFVAVMLHDIIVGYALFKKIEFDSGQIPMYLCTVVPCLVALVITSYIADRRRQKKGLE